MTTPALARHFRDTWLREARYQRTLAAKAATPEEQAQLLAKAKRCILNAWEARRLRGYGVAAR